MGTHLEVNQQFLWPVRKGKNRSVCVNFAAMGVSMLPFVRTLIKECLHADMDRDMVQFTHPVLLIRFPNIADFPSSTLVVSSALKDILSDTVQFAHTTLPFLSCISLTLSIYHNISPYGGKTNGRQQ